MLARVKAQHLAHPLCCAVLCCAVLCCAVLRCAVMPCVVLYSWQRRLTIADEQFRELLHALLPLLGPGAPVVLHGPHQLAQGVRERQEGGGVAGQGMQLRGSGWKTTRE